MKSVGADPTAVNDQYREAYEHTQAMLGAMEAGRRAPERVSAAPSQEESPDLGR